jgi:16S rRNA (uracil1498-N3)-methyltransferase
MNVVSLRIGKRRRVLLALTEYFTRPLRRRFKMPVCLIYTLPSMPRFYCPLPLLPGTIVDLPETVAHHLHVVRQQPGDEVVLFNGEGGQARTRLREIAKRRASAEVLALDAVDVELPYPITLAQGLPEGTKMDWIVEKAVELGVSGIQPLAAARSVVKLSGERAEKRQAHWEGVIVAASEQSGRNRLARLEPLRDFGRWIAQPADGPRILLSPRATQSLAGWARANPPQAVTLLIGPEGGFSAQEEETALAHGALALSMGPRVLRTETAGLAALATLNAVWAAD